MASTRRGGFRATLLALAIVGLFCWIVFRNLGALVLVPVAIMLAIDFGLRRAVPPSEADVRIKQGLCPACGRNLKNIPARTEYCPDCQQPIPAPLRKWQ